MSANTLGSRSQHSAAQVQLISDLERQLTNITQLLYTTDVPGPILDRQVLPFIADDIVFKDPWQEGGNKQLYRVGMKGQRRDSLSLSLSVDLFSRLSQHVPLYLRYLSIECETERRRHHRPLHCRWHDESATVLVDLHLSPAFDLRLRISSLEQSPCR